MVFRLMLVVIACLVLAISCGEAQAERPRLLGRVIAGSGVAQHGSYGGRENVYWDTGSRLGARIRAHAAWRQSPGHHANLLAGVGGFFRTRVVGVNGSVAVVGR